MIEIVRGEETAHLERTDPVVAQTVEHDQEVVSEVVGLRQIGVLRRVPHRDRIEVESTPQLLEDREVRVVDEDVDPHPAAVGHLRGELLDGHRRSMLVGQE
ncbi:MAG: hypothetical protein U5R31_07380 [Acidimicrobiia bacterium]|nr:hypothetical protein [Acidimicrobiia bacterium]